MEGVSQMEAGRSELAGRAFSWRRTSALSEPSPQPMPLIVALHGGTYTSAYFDVAGHSLLARAAALGVRVLALDRPGYGGTPALDPSELTHEGSAAVLDAALAALWSREGGGWAGIVLLGHSIGAAIAFRIAARRPGWPLLGIAASGVGLTIAPGMSDAASQFPPVEMLEMPQVLKDFQMFGPPDTFESSAREASRSADAPTPVAELLDIVATWPREAAAVLRRVAVPVHYRQGLHDNLWTVDPNEVERFALACAEAPRVDRSIVLNAGHCIDFHHPGAGFQVEQLGFALRCAGELNRAG